MRYCFRILLCFVVAALVAACSGTPDGVLSKHKMAQLLADIHEGEGVVEVEHGSFGPDSTRMALLASIYDKHGVTAEQVDSSMAWYGRNIEQYMEVYDEVIEILEKRLAKANSMSTKGSSSDVYNTSLALEGDSVDVWVGARHRRFTTLGGNDFITFRATRDSKWEEGDTYTLSLKLINPQRPVGVVMVTEYTDGSFDMASRELSGSGWQDLVLRQNVDKKANSVYLSINYVPEPGETMYVDSISLVRQHRKITRAGVHSSAQLLDSASPAPLPEFIDDETLPRPDSAVLRQDNP